MRALINRLPLMVRALILVPLLAAGLDQARVSFVCGPDAQSCLDAAGNGRFGVAGTALLIGYVLVGRGHRRAHVARARHPVDRRRRRPVGRVRRPGAARLRARHRRADRRRLAAAAGLRAPPRAPCSRSPCAASRPSCAAPGPHGSSPGRTRSSAAPPRPSPRRCSSRPPPRAAALLRSSRKRELKRSDPSGSRAHARHPIANFQRSTRDEPSARCARSAVPPARPPSVPSRSRPPAASGCGGSATRGRPGRDRSSPSRP